MPRLIWQPIEALRPAGLPVDDLHERQVTSEEFTEAIRQIGWDEQSYRGRWEDGSPRVRNFGGGLICYPRTCSFLPRQRDSRGRMVIALPRCEPCEMEFISAEYLDAHLEAKHGGDPG